MRNTDGRQVIQLRDPVTERAATNVWLAPGYMATTIVPLDRSDGGQDVGVLGYARTGKFQARVYDASTGRQSASVYFAAP